MERNAPNAIMTRTVRAHKVSVLSEQTTSQSELVYTHGNACKFYKLRIIIKLNSQEKKNRSARCAILMHMQRSHREERDTHGGSQPVYRCRKQSEQELVAKRDSSSIFR